jgi:demethylmacrocin O-methyltransferase
MENLKEFLKKELKKPSRKKLLNFIDDFRALPYSNNLCKLARIYRSDKVTGHNYAPHYQNHLRKFKNKRISLLEIGVGGYNDPNLGGNSLRLWKRYFPLGKIFSLDLHDKSALEEKRIKIFCGSQADNDFLTRVSSEIGNLDIIIDDGSHYNDHVIDTFKLLFPKLKDGGIYIVEDTQTSYWENYRGDSKDLENPKTMMNYFKRLTDCLNYSEFLQKDYVPTYFDRKIISMHFYHNLIFIYKGNNNEKSNIVTNK